MLLLIKEQRKMWKMPQTPEGALRQELETLKCLLSSSVGLLLTKEQRMMWKIKFLEMV